MFKISYVRKIWDESPHNAFPDLLRYQGRWLVSFRESSEHEAAQSSLGIITSLDGLNWKRTASIEMPGFDYRDPKLSIMPNNTLMLNLGGVSLDHARQIGSLVSFSKDGYQWTTPVSILPEGEWLWRVTWQQSVGYGVSYSKEGAFLYQTLDGLVYEKLAILPLADKPTEATIRFLKNEQMAIIIRRKTKAALLISDPHYTHFKVSELELRIDSPNFLIEDAKMIVAGRFLTINPYGLFERMGVSMLKGDFIESPASFPGVGDLGYPGLCFEDGEFYMCYYTSSEGKAALYFTKFSAK